MVSVNVSPGASFPMLANCPSIVAPTGLVSARRAGWLNGMYDELCGATGVDAIENGPCPAALIAATRKTCGTPGRPVTSMPPKMGSGCAKVVHVVPLSAENCTT